MTEDLKPCPFCGSSVKIESKTDYTMSKNPLYRAHCSNGHCLVQSPYWCQSEDDTLKHWNTRQEPDDIQEWLKHDIKRHLHFIRHVKNPRTMTDEEAMGYDEALEWVLSLKKTRGLK